VDNHNVPLPLVDTGGHLLVKLGSDGVAAAAAFAYQEIERAQRELEYWMQPNTSHVSISKSPQLQASMIQGWLRLSTDARGFLLALAASGSSERYYWRPMAVALCTLALHRQIREDAFTTRVLKATAHFLMALGEPKSSYEMSARGQVLSSTSVLGSETWMSFIGSMIGLPSAGIASNWLLNRLVGILAYIAIEPTTIEGSYGSKT
jgi:hypothetical protein